MKYILKIAALLMLLMLVVPAALAANLPNTGTVYVYNPKAGDRLNLRTQPSQDAPSLGKYYTGTAVYLRGERKNGYVKVSVYPFEGWMDENYLVTGSSANGKALPVTQVSASSANLRALEPSYDAAILGSYSKGTAVTVLAVRSDGWLHVMVGGRAGFMRSELVAGDFPYQLENGYVSNGTAGNSAIVMNPDPLTRLNLRSAPDGDASVLGKYYSGTAVTLLEQPKNGWVRVLIGGTAEGYVQTKFLAMNGQSVKSAMLSRTVSNLGGSGLNLRQGPGTQTNSLGFYRNGGVVTVMGIYGDWAHVTVDGKVGYMQADKFNTDYGMTFAPLK